MSKRSIPLWMVGQSKSTVCAGKVHEENCEKKLLQSLSENHASLEISNEVQTKEPTKRNLRSNSTFQIEAKKPSLNIEYLPFVEYNGKIEYYTLMHDIAFSCDQLLQWVQSRPDSSRIPIAFDLEWPFNFRTGPGRTALMQLCASTDRCLLLQLSCLKRLPGAVLELLHHPRVILHGVNIKNDFRKLARDYPGVDADRLIAQCCDIGQWYNKQQNSTGIWSMERLVHSILKQRINKDKRVRMSKWDALPLSDDQKMYAAIDVYISQELYLKLAEKELAQMEIDVRCEQELVISEPAVVIRREPSEL